MATQRPDDGTAKVAVVTLPEYAAQAAALLASQRVLSLITRLGLPQPALQPMAPFGVTEDMLRQTTKTACFGSFATPPHILLCRKFFLLPEELRQYVLTHELKHADIWLSGHLLEFFTQRDAVWVQWRKHVALLYYDDLFRFVSAPLETDIETWLLQLFPRQGWAHCSQRWRRALQAIRKHRRARGGELYVPGMLFDLVPLLHFLRSPATHHSPDKKQERALRSAEGQIRGYMCATSKTFLKRTELEAPLLRLLDEPDPVAYLSLAHTEVLPRLLGQ